MAASPGGPRYDAALSSEERSGPENAIWLCQTCAKLVDNDPGRFHAAVLHEWKRDAEKNASVIIGKTAAAAYSRETQQPALTPEIVGEAVTGSAFDAEIDEAKRLIESHKYEVARAQLERIRTRHWGDMTPWQKFRVLSNLGATFFGGGEFEKAAGFYLEARDFQPSNEQALANEALAFHLLGDSAKAFDVAGSVINRFPNSKRPLSVWINAAPQSMRSEDLEKRVPEHLKTDGEICLALAHRAFVENEFERAEGLARKATQEIPAHPASWLLLAQIQARREYYRIASSSNLFQEVDLVRAREAEGHVTRAIDLADTQRSSVLVEALVERAELRQLMGDAAGREEDLQRARFLRPGNVAVDKAYAGLLISRRDFTGAIDRLRAVKLNQKDAGLDLLLAATLQDRNQPGDLAEAAALFSEFLKLEKRASAGIRRLALGSAVECLRILGRQEDALKLIEEPSSDSVPQSFRLALSGQMWFSAGNTQAAFKAASQALKLLGATDSPEDVRAVALLLSNLGRYEEACRLWERLRQRGKWNFETKNLLECLSRLKRDKEALELCRELREAGVEDASLREYELGLLEKYDTAGAIRLLQDRLSRDADDQHARLRLSLIGLRLDRPELVTADPEGLPRVEGASARVGRAVVQVLQMGGRPDDALRYAYQLLRRYFSDPDAHIAYISTLIPFGPAPSVTQPTEVGVGSAVCYVEEPNGEERWIIIEDSDNADVGRGEYPSDHALVQRMLGRKTGETFVLAQGAVQDRTAKIKHVVSKYTYRFQDCMGQWQLRFPTTRAIESVPIVKGEGETYDLSTIERSVDRRHRAFDEVLAQYRSSLLPLHTFAEQFGRSVFTLVEALAQMPEVEIRCCNGSAAERDAAFAALDSAKAVVLEATGLATLGLLDDLTLLEYFPRSVIVSQSTINELRQLISEASMHSGEGGYIGRRYDGSGVVFVPETDENMRARTERLRRFVELLEARCQIEVCINVAGLPADRRKLYSDVFGQHGIESILLARHEGRVLWTDDWVVGGLAAGEFGVKRVWTQAALSWASSRENFPVNVFQEASAKLLGWRYSFTGMNLGILVRCGLLANWSPDRWPLEQALDRLKDTANDSQDVLALSAGFIVQLYKECFLPELRQVVIIRILERLMSRSGGPRLVDALHRALPRLFGLNLLASADANAIIQSWRRGRAIRM